MPPKRPKLKPFSWVSRNGKLTTFLEGVLFGLHLHGASASDIADLLRLGRNPVYDVIRSVESRLEAERSPTRDDSDTSSEEENVVSPAVEARRKEKDDDGQYRVQTSKALRIRLSVNVCTRTIHRDLLALGFRWVARPALTDDQRKKRLDMADELLSNDMGQLCFPATRVFSIATT